MAMPMLAQFLPAPAGGPVRGGRRGSRRAGQRIGLRLLASRAGNVAVEFALAAPVLMMLMLASAELARFVILHQKMDRVATTISDLVSRAETINETEMADIFEAIGEVASPFSLADLGV
jgi:Flp pilus assembly protein TadG